MTAINNNMTEVAIHAKKCSLLNMTQDLTQENERNLTVSSSEILMIISYYSLSLVVFHVAKSF